MSCSNNPSRVLVVDDDEAVRRVVRLVLQREKYQVGVAATGRQGLDSLATQTPDLIILDICLPDMGGLEVLQELRTWYRGPVMILSGNGEEMMVTDALDTGADDYLTKPFRPSEMLARIRALLRRSDASLESPRVIDAGGLKVDLAKRRVLRDGREIRLTRTEFEILVYLAQNLDRVVSSKMILDKVWGPTHGDYIRDVARPCGTSPQENRADALLPAVHFDRAQRGLPLLGALGNSGFDYGRVEGTKLDRQVAGKAA